MRTTLLFCALLMSCATSKHVTKSVNPNPPLPLRSDLRTGRLPNGLTYYVLRNRAPLERAVLWLAVNAGSVQEDDDQRGLAHFDEHMAFNGTQHFPKSAIIDYLEKIGMRFGADVNAHTSFEDTVYELEIPTYEFEFMEKGFEILRDWAAGVSFDPVEVDKERGVVREEWRLHRGAMQRLREKQMKVLFAGTRYAERQTIGLPDVIDHASRDKLQRFYRDWYRPDLMAIIVVGDFDPFVVEKELYAHFSDLPAAERLRARPTGGMAQPGTRYFIDSDSEAPSTMVSLANLAAHRSEPSRRDYRRHVVQMVYNQIINERLDSIERKPDAPFVNARAQIAAATRDIDAFDRWATVKSDRVEDAVRTLLTEARRIDLHGVTQPELDRARRRIQAFADKEAAPNRTTFSNSLADELKRHFFTGEPMPGPVGEQKLIAEDLPTITVAELDDLMKPFRGDQSRVVSVVGPEGKTLPSEAALRAIVDDVEKTNVPPWEEKAVARPLWATPPVPGKIVSEKRVFPLNATEWTLSNGARVVVMPTDYDVDTVQIRAESPGGTATASDTDFVSAKYPADIVIRGGVGDLDADTLEKILAGKSVHVVPHIGQGSEGIDASGSTHDLETILQLVYLRMTAPRKDPDAFAVWQAHAEQTLQSELRSPEGRFASESNDAEWHLALRRRSATPADVKSIDLDKALAFYRDRFGDASDFTFVIVGNVSAFTLRPLVEKYVASLPASGRKEQEKDLHVRRVPNVFKKEWKYGKEPKARVSIEFHGEEEWTRDKQRDLSNLETALRIRLREVLREDLGGVYNVETSASFQRSPYGEHTLRIRFTCDPQRVDELTKATHDVVAQIQRDGVSADLLEKVRTSHLRKRETDLRNNTYWARWLVNAYWFGDDPTIIKELTPVLARMTSANIQAAAKHYLDDKQVIELTLRPEN